MRFIVLKDICPDILSGDEVSLVPEYTYMIGTEIRIKEYFDVENGEVVVSKLAPKASGEKATMSIAKCKRQNLSLIKCK